MLLLLALAPHPHLLPAGGEKGAPVSVQDLHRGDFRFHLLPRYSTELRDMTLFHELLNKKGRAINKPIIPDARRPACDL